MSEFQRYFVLVLTQMICTIVVLWIARDFLPKKVYKLIGLFAILTVVSLLYSRPSFELLHLNLRVFSINITIWIIYLLDIVALFILIHKSGGLSQSPFSPLLILLPTNGIILNQPFLTVLKYYLGTLVAAILLLLCSPEIIINKDEISDYKMAVFIIYLFILISSILGYWLPLVVKI